LERRWVPTTLTPTTLLDGGLGSGSLRDAVLQFNADTGTADDIIQLLPGTYSLTIRNTHGHENGALEGDLNLTQTSHRWIIQGAGPSTNIDASRLQDRVFQIVNPGTQVVFQDLVIQGGLAQDNGTEGALPGTTDALGGGLLNNGGNLTLDDVVVQNNAARGGDGGTGQDGHNAQGGGLYSTGGALTIIRSTITADRSNGGHGGDGTFYTITSTNFQSTRGSPGGGGGAGQGGGLYLGDGFLDISGSMIDNDEATGGEGGRSYPDDNPIDGPPGGAGQGGGLYGRVNMATLTNSTISDNSVRGGDGGCSCGGGIGGYGNGGIAGPSQGGGLYFSGDVAIANSTIASNTVGGGRGGSGGQVWRQGNGGASQGGGVYDSGRLTVINSTIASNTLFGGDGRGSDYNGGNGGASQGGGVYTSGMLTVTNSTIAMNTLRGGDGGSGGDSTHTQGGTGGASQGGGLYGAGTLTVANSTIANNSLRGGDGGGNSFYGTSGDGGTSQGGGVYGSGTLTVTNSTIAINSLRGGDGGNGRSQGGNGGAGLGGGLWVAAGGTAQISFSTVATNHDTGGMGGSGFMQGSDGPATGGGLNNQGMLQTRDTILALNTVNGLGSNSAPDLSGTFGSLGHNLVGNTQGGSGFDGTDLLNIDPLLGRLQCNGGPTQTMALLPGSPALNAGDPNELGTADQRGVVRTGGVNIGAYQASATAFVLSAPDTVQSGTPFDVTVTALDPFGQVAVGYVGTVTFSASDPDPGVVLPADYTFTPDDGGSHTFTDTGLGEITLVTPGDQVLTATDIADATITGSATVTVDPRRVSSTVW
jgi:hypothetical protein